MTPLDATESPPVMGATPVAAGRSVPGTQHHSSTSLSSGFLRWTTLILAAGCAVVILAGAAAPWLWLGDLAVHWSGHAAIGLLPALVVWRRWARFVVPLVLLLMAAVTPGVRSLMEPRLTVVAAPAKPISVAFANVYDFNRERARALQAINGIDAEVVGLAEVSVQDRAQMTSTRWPFQHWEDREGTLSVALLSSHPILSAMLHDVDGAGVLEATIDLGQEQHLRIIVAHLFSPKDGASAGRRNEQLRFVTHLIATDQHPLLLLGDLNLSPASPHWRSFINKTGFTRAPGPSPATWPTSFGWCGIGIDHLLARKLGLTDVESLAVPGSDHRGLRAIAWLSASGGD